MTKKIDPKAPKRPKSVKSFVEFVNKKLPIDQRTVQARSIKAVKQAVEADLDETAIQLLRDDVAVSTTIMAMCMAQVSRQPDKMIQPDGSYTKVLGSWLKFSAVKRASLMALKKFQEAEIKEPKEPGLGDMVLEVSAMDAKSEQPDTADDAREKEQAEDGLDL